MKTVLLIMLVSVIIGVGQPAFAKKSTRSNRRATYLATVYYTPHASEYNGKKFEWLRNRSGKNIARVPGAFAKAARLNGTARLADDRLVHCIFPHGRCDILKNTLVAGALGLPLTPFRAIAVDPRYIRLKTAVYIKEFDGLFLPDGSVHNGIFTAMDTGGHIKGKRLDIFVGSKKKWDKFKHQLPLPALVTVKRLPQLT